MDPHDEELNRESCEELYRQYVQKYNKFSADLQLASAVSQDYLQLLKNHTEDPKGKCKQNGYMQPPEQRNSEEVDTQTASCRTYKYVQHFRKTIEAYPMNFEWFPKKIECNKQNKDHNKDSEQDSPLENCSNNNEISLGSSSSISIIIKDELRTPGKQEIPEANGPPPKCPPLPCEAYNIKFECGIKDMVFKLKCKEQPLDREHPNSSTYECKLVDEGQCLDMVIAMAATDLKCKRVEAIHGLHSIMVHEETEHVQGPIVVKQAENEREDKGAEYNT